MTGVATTALVPLGDPRAADPALSGVKAAALAAAWRAGLPVLPGFVVPVAESRQAIASGVAALAARNPGFAQAVVTGNALDPALDSAITDWSAQLGERLVARSSAVVEDGGVWAGAFASYAELAPDEVSRAVRGCWASVFTRDALQRGQSVGAAPDDVGMAVLVQPEIVPTHGGVADVGRSGTVRIAWIEGPPAAIVSGWERGHITVVTMDGTGARVGDAETEDRLRRVADLARRVAAELGRDRIEWADADGTTWLLQASVRTGKADDDRGEAVPVLDGRALATARLLIKYPGPVGERYVLQWAVGVDRLPDQRRPAGGELLDMLAEATRIAEAMSAARWGEGGEAGVRALRTALRRLADGADPVELAPDAGYDGEAGGRILGILDTIARRLVERNRLPHPEWLWHLEPAELESIVAGTGRRPELSRRIGTGRWEPLVHGIVAGAAEPVDGHAAAAGWGAGALRLVRDAGDAATVPPRAVVAAVYPLNNLAPLLWDAAGLVTVGGNPGAHLFEVASWLGVPAVCGIDLQAATGCPLPELRTRAGVLAAVDGTAGRVSIVPTDL